jgi:dihydroflavonol-4-reductase
MAALVTGASGHVGANLVRTLLARGTRVRVLIHRDKRGIEGLDAEIAYGDVCDLKSLDRALTGMETVYHLAAAISLTTGGWQEVESVNVSGTRNVVEACLKYGVKRLIHFSSIHALDHRYGGNIIDESCALGVSPRECLPYNRSKALAEREVHRGIERGLNAIIIRPTAIIGPYDFYPSYFGEVLLSLAAGKLPALVAGGYDWVDVRDVVSGALRAGDMAPSGSIFLLSGHWADLCEVASIVEDITGVKAPGLICPMWLAAIGAPLAGALSKILKKRPLYSNFTIKTLRTGRRVSHEKATREISYNPRPLRETIEDTLRWFRDNGRLNRLVKSSPQEG